jgi:hypothetical protein
MRTKRTRSGTNTDKQEVTETSSHPENGSMKHGIVLRL